MNGKKRNLSSKISWSLANFPIVVLLGVRQVGKTTLSKDLCPDWLYVDLERPGDFEEISYDPEFFFKQHPRHVIFDEAQLYPQLFNLLRSVVDENRNEKGRFLITGSSSPDLMRNVSESLAGRVGIIELGTFKCNELYERPLSPFYEMLTKPIQIDALLTLEPQVSLEKLQQAWFRGGYPEPALQNDVNFYNAWMENYHDTYINRDLAQLFPRLNKRAYSRFLSMLGHLSGSIINRSNLARAIEVNEGTVRDYIEIANGTYVWRNLPSYEKNIEKALIKMPKGHLRDTGLLHHLLDILDINTLYRHPIVGLSFEGFVIEEIIKGIQSTLLTNWSASYYRTRNGAEIDLMLDGPFGILPIEIKYGSTVQRKQLKTLTAFLDEHHLPLGLLINQGEKVTQISDKIVQIPATVL